MQSSGLGASKKVEVVVRESGWPSLGWQTWKQIRYFLAGRIISQTHFIGLLDNDDCFMLLSTPIADR
jgi:hypothetical protein